LITRVIIEQFYENLEEATIGRWIKAEGDPVEKEEPLVEIITDKVTFEMPSPGAGRLRSIIAVEKSVLPVGYVIALIGDDGDEFPDVWAANAGVLEKRKLAVEAAASSAPSQAGESVTTPPTATAQSVRDRGAVRATPAARRVAREHNIDLAQVSKSLGGRLVQEEDVREWLMVNG
jgi:pyruvate/2-oxoglutarate dehydrogenase complex dihydrolipoamide acyltransferase (E2) component